MQQKIAEDFKKIAGFKQKFEGKDVFTSKKVAEFESNKKSQTTLEGKISDQNKQEKTSVQKDKIRDSVSEADTSEKAVLENKNFEQKKISFQTDTVTKLQPSVRKDPIKDKPIYSQIIRSITGKHRLQDLCFTAYNILTECELEEMCTVDPLAKRQCISVPSFEGFAKFHNQFCNIVPKDSIVNDSALPEEHTSLEGKLTFLDSQINGGEPSTSLQSSNVNPLPEFIFSLSSVTLDEMVKRYGFNHNDHALSDLEEVYVEQPAKFHTYYHNN
ncbi:hypothetical protein wTpre_512 [Wolbachia endosymbiont of Trichogramma pretiosum]|nr:hypothetical protein wTpre_512 [Wolbachia endosymbiont of Trichogramma pretiosum]